MKLTCEQIIEETASFYNLGNRGVNGSGSCDYLGVKGRMCAVGRCMTEEKLHKANNLRLGSVLNTSEFGTSEQLDSYLQEKYQGHSRELWIDLQRFHDDTQYWTDEGLSNEGLEWKEFLLRKWADDKI